MKRSMTREIILGAVCYQEYSGAYLDFLELAAELKLSWVEFKYEPPLCYRDGSRRYLDIRKQADDFGIGLSMHTAFDGLNIATLEDEERIRSLDTVKESIDAAAQMGISLATLHAGYLSSVDYSLERWSASREINITSIRELVGFARERGVTLCLENGNAFKRVSLKHGVHPGDLKFIREQAGEELGFTVDFGHALYLSEDPSFLVSELGLDSVRLSHLHSNGGMIDTHSPLNTGVLELGRIMEKSVEEKWDFPISIEMKSEEDLRGSVQTFRDAAARLGIGIAEP